MPIPVVVSLALVVLLATTGTATASTVERDQFGFLLYRGEGAEQNRLSVAETDDDYVLTDTPTVTLTPGAGCRDDGNAATTNVALCAKTSSGVIIIELGAGDDEIDPTDVRWGGFLYRGGDGDDVLRGPTAFGSSASMIGDAGTDEYVAGNPSNFHIVSYVDRSTPVTASLDDVRNDPDGENVPSGVTGVGGGGGNDTIIGSAKGDYLAGGAGDDRVSGLGGSDDLSGSAGNDDLDGGEGNDLFRADAGADIIRGGPGFDRFEAQVAGYEMSFERDVTVTLDDVANDGGDGEGDNVGSDVEDLTAVARGGAGRATLVGDADVNVLSGSRAADTLDGGAGGDILLGAAGDDTVNARDGFNDRVDCGAGTDTANADLLDQVANCETVNRADVAREAARPDDRPPAAEDRPPAAAFASPAEDALLGTASPSTITVTASDDRGVSRVVLIDDGRVVGTDDTAPYAFSYRPSADDVGRNTLVAIAVDASEQTGTAIRAVRVGRFLPGIVARAVRARDRRAPYRFRVVGGLRLPSGVSVTACRGGVVSVQVKRGARTISTRRVKVKRTCAFSSTVTFRDRRRLRSGRLKATARWLGTPVLAPRTARTIRLRAG